MADRRLVWHLFPSYLLLALAGILAVSLYASDALRDLYWDKAQDDLQARAYFAAQHYRDMARAPLDPAALQKSVSKLGKDSETRITIIRADGVVLADSMRDPASMENHAERPEVRAALAGQTGRTVRHSATVNQEQTYVAIPVSGANREIATVVRVSLPTTRLEEAVDTLQSRLYGAMAAIAAIAVLVSWAVSRRVVRPIEGLTARAKRMAEGVPDKDLPMVSGSLEVRELSEAMIVMARQLENRIGNAVQEKNEREAVLRSMAEGVIAIDFEQRLLTVNRKAAEQLGVDLTTSIGKPLPQIVRNTALLDLASRTLESDFPQEAEFEIAGDDTIHIQAAGAVLRNAANKAIGAVLVLNDVTRLKRLEQVRRDFVSNVSHELRTPLTSVKGFVETLLDGAIDSEEDARRFLEIIGKHVDRLNAIIEDLLTLSRLEQDDDARDDLLEPGAIAGPIREAVQICQRLADDKQVSIDVDCESGLYVNMNSALMEQCIVNLLDNAIKYSPAEATIAVTVEQEAGRVRISVRDEGCGIPSHHLDRLFERFYRVDTARSRGLGGTGLGLAIVRHIVELHGGRIDVTSELGKGTTFVIELAAAESPVAV